MHQLYPLSHNRNTAHHYIITQQIKHLIDPSYAKFNIFPLSASNETAEQCPLEVLKNCRESFLICSSRIRLSNSNLYPPVLTLFDMGFFEPSVMGGMRDTPHHNFVVIAPMIMKFGTGVKPDVFH